MTEKEKMISGQLYCGADPELKKLHTRAIELCDRLNTFLSKEEREELLRQLLGKCGEKIYIAEGFRCDYGFNIQAGNNLYVNYNVTILDVCRVTIGENCLIAPNVGIYTACHPLERDIRTSGLELGKPITIGNDCWIGGHAVINPGVTLGDNVVVGSGSVVTKSFPSNVVIAGNPAKIIKRL